MRRCSTVITGTVGESPDLGADFTAGLEVYALTGRNQPGGDDNLGLGIWSFEVFGDSTVCLDKAQSWHFVTTRPYRQARH
jgi:hypothetical protein